MELKVPIPKKYRSSSIDTLMYRHFFKGRMLHIKNLISSSSAKYIYVAF